VFDMKIGGKQRTVGFSDYNADADSCCFIPRLDLGSSGREAAV
jgi:hypothetical protein